MLYREDAGRKVATDQPGQAATDPADGLVPVRWIEFASDHEAAAYAIADNRLTEKNPMDPAQVAEIFLELDDAGVSLDGLGYGEEELKVMLDPVGVDDVKWKEFDESVGDGAPKGKEIKCPHCGETFTK